MKTKRFSVILAVALTTVAVSDSLAAVADVGAALARQFGEAYQKNVVLLKAPASAVDPAEWKVYSIDPYREGELLRTIVTKADGKWDAKPAGSGKLLQRVPKQRLDFNRLRIDSREARRIAEHAAEASGTTFAKVDYQLAAHEQTAVPEWGLALQDATGYEVGFCVISGETGAILSEDWTPKPGAVPIAKPDKRPPAQRAGEEAAKKVKRSVRKAWEWTEHAGRTTGSFFRELFR